MKNTALALALLAIASTHSAAHAATGVTAGFGSNGFALHVSVPMSDSVNARFGINGATGDEQDSTDDVDYNFKLKLSNIDALVDYFPMKGAFRLTSGLVYNGNKIDTQARASEGTFTLNDRTYAASTVGNLNGEIKFNKIAPYLGIGFGNAAAADKTWGFSSDFGVLFQGSPKTSLSNTGCTASASVCSQIASDVQVENGVLKEDVKDFKLLPVIRFGISYKF